MWAGPSLPCQLVTFSQSASLAASAGSSRKVPVASRPPGVWRIWRLKAAVTCDPAFTGIRNAIAPTAATAATGSTALGTRSRGVTAGERCDQAGDRALGEERGGPGVDDPDVGPAPLGREADRPDREPGEGAEADRVL